MDTDVTRENNTTPYQILNSERDTFGEMTIKKECFEDPQVTDLDEIKDGCKEIPVPKIKEEFLESCEGTEQEFPGQDPAVGGCVEIISQDRSVKEEKVGEILIKEEIKEEDLENQSSLTDENKESLNFQDQNLAIANDQTVIEDRLQKKMRYPTSVVDEVGFVSQSNSEAPLFNQKGDLKKQSPTIEKHFKCSSCPYQAAKRGIIKQHERTHTGEKPFKCSACDYQTAFKVNLKAHEGTHTGEKPFKCTSCPYQAAKKWTLKLHERTHTGEKPFQCSSCNYQTAFKVNLKAHKGTHTGEKPFKCASCPYQAAKKWTLKMHERTH